MNLQLNYCYRDGANYKQFGVAVFSNATKLTLEAVEQQIKGALIDGLWFVAADWQLPALYRYTYDPAIDHGWHEFESVQFAESGGHEMMDVSDWLRVIAKVG